MSAKDAAALQQREDAERATHGSIGGVEFVIAEPLSVNCTVNAITNAAPGSAARQWADSHTMRHGDVATGVIHVFALKPASACSQLVRNAAKLNMQKYQVRTPTADNGMTITAHKSKGGTFSRIIMTLHTTSLPQLYTMVSRVRRHRDDLRTLLLTRRC